MLTAALKKYIISINGGVKMNGLDLYVYISFGFTAFLIALYLFVFKVLKKGNNEQGENDINEEDNQ